MTHRTSRSHIAQLTIAGAVLALMVSAGCSGSATTTSPLSPAPPAVDTQPLGTETAADRTSQVLSFKLRGRITAIAKDSITVYGHRLSVTPKTQITALRSGRPIPFTSLRVGMQVLVTAEVADKTRAATATRIWVL